MDIYLTFTKKQKKQSRPYVKMDMAIEKANDELQIVYGWANVSEVHNQPIKDLQGDIIESEILEKAAYDFMENSRRADKAHKEQGVGVVVESMYFSKEKKDMLGIDLQNTGWWVGIKVLDKSLWQDIKDGKYSMFSIGGWASY